MRVRIPGLALLAGATLAAVAGVLLGAWWLTYPVGVAAGLLAVRPRQALAIGAAAGLLGWALPLLYFHGLYGIGPSAAVIAGIMGFGGQGLVAIILTCVIGLLLGLTGAWTGAAARSLAAPRKGA